MFEALQNTGVSTWIREANSLMAFPGILTLHTMGLGVLVGAAAVVDLRLLGMGGRMPIAPLRDLFRLMWAGFVVNAITGTLLFGADAVKRGSSVFFLAKLLLVTLGVVTMVLIKRDAFGPKADPMKPSATAKRLAIASLLIWSAAITAGRLLAYVE